MPTKKQIIDLNLLHPDWTVRQIADHLECKPQYIEVCKRRYSLTFPRATQHYENSITALGRAAKKAGLTVKDLQGMAAVRRKVEEAMA